MSIVQSKWGRSLACPRCRGCTWVSAFSSSRVRALLGARRHKCPGFTPPPALTNKPAAATAAPHSTSSHCRETAAVLQNFLCLPFGSTSLLVFPWPHATVRQSHLRSPSCLLLPAIATQPLRSAAHSLPARSGERR